MLPTHIYTRILFNTSKTMWNEDVIQVPFLHLFFAARAHVGGFGTKAPRGGVEVKHQTLAQSLMQRVLWNKRSVWWCKMIVWMVAFYPEQHVKNQNACVTIWEFYVAPLRVVCWQFALSNMHVSARRDYFVCWASFDIFSWWRKKNCLNGALLAFYPIGHPEQHVKNQNYPLHISCASHKSLLTLSFVCWQFALSYKRTILQFGRYCTSLLFCLLGILRHFFDNLKFRHFFDNWIFVFVNCKLATWLEMYALTFGGPCCSLSPTWKFIWRRELWCGIVALHQVWHIYKLSHFFAQNYPLLTYLKTLIFGSSL